MTPTRAKVSPRSRFEALVLSVWFEQPTKPNPVVRLLLWLIGTPLSWLTHAKASATRKQINFAKTNPPTPPVLVVGNLIAGGTGKTPMTIAIANALTQRNRRVGIICRGDGAQTRVQTPHMVNQQSTADTMGDEALLLFLSTHRPVCVCAQRDLALRHLLTTYPDIDVVIADDGLQHKALNRSIEIALFDQRGVGNGRLLPAGPLREPLSHLADMDALILNRGVDLALAKPIDPALRHPNTFSSQMSICDVVTLAQFNQSEGTQNGQPTEPVVGQSIEQFVDSHHTKSVAALAGIANPSAFFASLESFGLQVRPIALADHGALGPEDLSAIDEPIIIMTAKDAVKCPADPRVYVLRVQANPPTDLINWITEKLNGLPAA